MWVYDKTEMDCLVLADYYFRKRIWEQS
jgi:hypothetical protein